MPGPPGVGPGEDPNMPSSGFQDIVLVAFSLAVSMLAACSAVDLADRHDRSAGPRGLAWLVAAAVTMGGGIWCMHFVSVLAFARGGPQYFDVGLTLLSLAIGMVLSGISFVAGRHPGRLPPLVSGIAMGAAIGTMHYTGIAAGVASMHPMIGNTIVTLVVAVFSSTFSMLVISRGRGPWHRLVGSLLLGISVAGTHYAALLGDPGLHRGMGVTETAWSMDRTVVGLVVGGLTSAILALGLLAARADRRNEQVARSRAEALEDSEATLRQFYRTIPMPHHALDPGRALTEVSDRWVELTGFPREAVIGRTLRSFMTPESADAYDVACDRADAAMSELHDFPCRMVAADRNVMDVLLSTRTERDPSGRTVSSLGGITDVTARNKAEEALRHAQKLEVIGRITGGVAHDYNNVLSVIFGNLELGTKALEAGNPDKVRRCLGNAFLGAERARDLTARLLAFSRKQPLQPTVLDIGDLLGGMARMLRQTLGESIAHETFSPAGAWETLADRNQLENALLNLALNAREAMPSGGKLEIVVSNRHLDDEYAASRSEVSPGDYVMVSVSDTGRGMSRDVLSRAVEPFFTTKGVGGSGLGLSQVFGFVKQSGGHLEISSTEGAGTTVILFLPRAGLPARVTDPAPATRAGPPGTVLLVEDEQEVRLATADVVSSMGYRVLEACDAPSALLMLDREQVIDLLLTDVGLPGMNGRQLALEARKRRPGLPVMFVTGYSWDAFSDDGGCEGMTILQKPFKGHELASKMAEALGYGTRAAAWARRT